MNLAAAYLRPASLEPLNAQRHGGDAHPRRRSSEPNQPSDRRPFRSETHPWRLCEYSPVHPAPERPTPLARRPFARRGTEREPEARGAGPGLSGLAAAALDPEFLTG